ncbi:CAP domain-containing protein [Demequina sp.]|uniref:CAP domain-containing protein n=1 Tax=Demequina sp. TaxID=2050685 RepID=UPI003A88810E
MRRPLRAASILALVTGASALTGCTGPQPADIPDPATYEAQLLEQINALRLPNGRDRLAANDCLTAHARERAQQLPGAQSAPEQDLPHDCGGDYLGENISRSDLLPADVTDAWASDDLQRPNLLDPLFTTVGVGCVGVALEDTSRVALDGEDLASMACSVIFQGDQE